MWVKTTYRAYGQDEYIEIVENSKCQKSLCGLIPYVPIVRWGATQCHKVVSIWWFSPFPFITWSRALITEAFCKKMINQFAMSKPKVAEEFLDSSPETVRWCTRVRRGTSRVHARAVLWQHVRLHGCVMWQRESTSAYLNEDGAENEDEAEVVDKDAVLLICRLLLKKTLLLPKRTKQALKNPLYIRHRSAHYQCEQAA